MAGASGSLHEAPGDLEVATVERHRAIVSLMEELEAVDWYDQRIDATSDPELARLLVHNRDEEKEHAVMTLEWLRRNDPVWDTMLRQYLFTERPITEVEEEVEARGGPEEAPSGSAGAHSLGIGSLRGRAS